MLSWNMLDIDFWAFLTRFKVSNTDILSGIVTKGSEVCVSMYKRM